MRNPYAEDYEAELQTREDRSRIRRINRDSQRLLDRSNNPTGVSQYFDFGHMNKQVKARTFDMTPLNPWDGADPDPTGFVQKVEDAYTANRGNIPMAWLVAQDPDDIALMDPDVAREIYETQDDMFYQAQFEAKVKEETTNRIRSQERLRTLLMEDVTTRSTALPAEDRLKVEQEVRNEMLGTGVTATSQAAAQRPWTDAFFGIAGLIWGGEKVVSTGISILGKVLDGATRAALSMTGVPQAARGLHDMNFLGMQDKWQAEQDAAVEAAQAEASLPTAVLTERLRGQSYLSAFQQLETEDPQTYQDLMTMANGNKALGFAFFSDMMDNEVAVQDQLRALVEDPEHGYRKDLNEFVDTLEESDYSFTDTVMDALSAYKLPMQLATATAIFLTDEDIRQQSVTEGWHNLWDQVSKNKNSPARALGLENTAVGMLVDLGGGIAFDPLNMIFGPRMMGMLGRASSRAGVAALQQSPFVTRVADDAVRLAYSDSAGISQLVHTLGWLDDTGDLASALEVLGGVDKTLPGRPYLFNDARALYVEEVNLANAAARLLDPEDLAKFNALDDVDNLVASVRGEGFNGSLELTYATREGTLHLTDGLKRLRAAQQAGLRSVPVTVRVTDTLQQTVQTAARQLLPDDPFVRSMASINEGAAGFAYHFSDDLTPEVAQRIVDGQEPFTRGGITNDRVKGLATQAPGGDPIVLVFDQANMSSQVQEALRTRDITNISSVRGTRPRPVGWVRLSEFDQFAQEAMATVADNAPREFGQPTITTRGPAGVPLADLWPDGSPPSVPKTMEGVLPNVGDNTYVRPTALLGREFVLGQDAVQARAALNTVIGRALSNGATPSGMYRYVIARGWRDRIAHMTRNAEGVQWVKRYVTPQNTVQRFEFYGPDAVRYIADSTMRMWGDDTAKIDLYLGRLYDLQRRQAAGNMSYVDDLSRLEPDIRALQAMQDMQGGGWDNSLRLLDDAAQAGDEAAALAWEQSKANRAQLQQEVAAETRRIDNEIARIDAVRTNSLPGGAETNKLMEDMWDDFNRTHIASKPFWAEYVDPKTKMVPWEELRRGRPTGVRRPHEGGREFLPAEMQEIAKELGVPGETLAQELVDVLHEPMAFNAPLSPLEMVMASEAGGARWTRLSQEFVAGSMRQRYLDLTKWWVMDKVMQPAVAVTVGFDELQRWWHIGGYEGVARWMQARIDNMSARVASIRHKRFNVQSGAEHLSRAAQARIQEASNLHVRYAQAERTTLEGMGLGWDDIRPNQPGYLDAARRWSGDLLQSSSFRAYLRGPEAFKEWFRGADGLQMRQGIVLKDGTANLLGRWEDAYQGWNTLFERIALHQAKKDGVFAEVLQAFKETAARIDATGGQPHNLPSMVFDHLGPVRGVRKHVNPRNFFSAGRDWFFDQTFMDSVNARRGALASHSRAIERVRLTRLFTDQGRRIVSEGEIQMMESMRGFQGTRPGLRRLRDQRLLETGLIPESYIEDLADLRAMDEVDNVLYTWDRASRMGMQSRAVFPFGRPWADMVAFWGREVLTRPALRGPLAKSVWANSLVDAMRFNPKPLAMISRLAQTDMSVKELWPGQELPFGAEEMNFSPLLFLPTSGENPLGSLLPGLGFVPLFAMDQLLQVIHDPVEDPLAYQQLVDDVAQVFPSAAYTRGGPISDVLGGGVLGRGLGVLSDVMAWQSGKSFFNSASLLGDISRETANTRELSVLLADPEVLRELVAITDPDMLEIQLQGLVLQAVKQASGSSIAGSVTRAALPIRAEYDSSVGELQDVWLAAAKQWPTELQPSREYDLTTDEGRRQASNDIRNRFFDLPQWKRDLFVVEQPALAVNLVGGWEWTTKAKDDLGFKTTASYRTGGTPADLARHQLYIDRGYVRPLNLLTRAQRILALQQASKDNSARRMYEMTAAAINETIWTTRVSDKTRQILTNIAESEFGRQYGYQTAREVWENWGTVESDLERHIAQTQGVGHLDDEYDRITEMVSIPSKERGWGRSFPGLDELQVSGRFEDVTINKFRPEVQAIADVLDIELTPGMNGAQFYRGIQDVMTTRDTPLWGMVEATYDEYVNERSVEATAAEGELRTLTRNPNLSPEFRDQANAFFRYVSNLEHRLSAGNEQPRPSVAEQEEVARRYKALQYNGSGLMYDWDGGWEARFQRRYGPLDWTPPEPAPVMLEDGRQNPNAYQPYIQRIVDGDTLTVSEAFGAGRLIGPATAEARPRMHDVRLLGILAPELLGPGGRASKQKLEDALMAALENGDRIWLVRDPDTFGASTDAYGRELAWLWIGDTPYHDPSSLRREVTPSGPLEGEE